MNHYLNLEIIIINTMVTLKVPNQTESPCINLLPYGSTP